ncbi:MAG: hypothetical protein LBG67_03425 [Campylobacteraceae bacterium]|jgi:antitoxin component YwqK of YwqJK toxin-antitoxin module|nr:hypothetical protein [Campylobacteraceae bacterium]
MKKTILLATCCTFLFSDTIFYNEILGKWVGVESTPCTKNTNLKINASRVPNFNKGDYFVNSGGNCFEIKTIFDGNKLIEHYDNSWSVAYFENGVVIGWFRTFFGNNALKSETFFNNGAKEGKSKEFYESGILKLEQEYSNNLLNGQTVEYEFNGRPIKVNTYKNNMKHGIERIYNVQGRPVKQLEYSDNILLPQYKTYHYDDDNGDLSCIASYKGGKENGSWLYYDKNGDLKQEVIYENGKQLKVVSYSM